jgi:hypothetical protein
MSWNQRSQAVEDVDQKFKLITQLGGTELALSQLAVEEGSAAGPRRPHKVSSYALCKRAGLDVVVAALGISPSKFAENLEDSYKRHEPEDLRVAPEEFASEHVTEVVCAPFSVCFVVFDAVMFVGFAGEQGYFCELL